MDLSKLPVEGGVRMRGEHITRLETFVDAAFAFAVTLLVVSFDAMPSSFTELYDALRRLPAFLAGFAIIATFWHSHNRFSRRFGLEDGWITFLSLTLVAATLFYVYPLRMVMSAAMRFFTGGWAPSEVVVGSFLEFRLVFIIYGLGFAALAGLIAAMNLHALRKADVLQLDEVEQLAARSEVVAQLVLAAVAGLSILIAATIPPGREWAQALPGLIYCVLGIAMPLIGIHYGRRTRELIAKRDAS